MKIIDLVIMIHANRALLFFGVAVMIACALGTAYWLGTGAEGGTPISTGLSAALPVETTPPASLVPATTSATVVPFVSGRKLSDTTLSLAKADPKSSYDDVAKYGGTFTSLDRGNTFGVWWQPEDFDAANDTVLVSLGGHAGWATRDFSVWYPHIAERGYGFLTLQWWLGRSLENAGYYEPEEMYAMIRQVLAEKGIPPGHVIFQGYSMGSARSYGITALDSVGGKYFAVTISNSGVWEDDYPITADIIAGKYGAQPFAGIDWILYCAVNDEEHPDWNKCEKMDTTQTNIEKYGGKVDLYIKDETGSHGSFMVNSDNVRRALDVADDILSTK